MNARQGNLVSGIAALGLVAFIFYYSMDMPSTAAAFPRFIASLLLVAAIILIVRSSLDRRPQPQLFEDIHWPTVLIVGCAWLITIFVVEQLGFLLPGVVFIAAVTWVLSGRPKDVKSFAKIGLFAVCMLALYFGIFHILLDVGSPAGESTLLW